ncbi:GroES-like protein [Hymenopellis radicata]|nr:GroES-like protein [Hymenopellis radicata]
MIPSTMFSASYQGGNTDLVIDKAHSVLIKVSASGVCHSDVALLSGAGLDNRTYIMGTNSAEFPSRNVFRLLESTQNSRLSRLGEGVDPHKAKLGKLYTIITLTPCVRGLMGLPAIFNSVGIGRDGGYADYVVVPQDQLVPVPEGVSIEEASMAGDAATAAYHAVHDVAGIKEGTNFKVLMFGIGGLGHLGLQYAKHYGATVYAVDIKPEARKLALELGAEAAYDLATLNELLTANKLTVDITIDFAATTQTFEFAVSALKGNGLKYPSDAKAVMVGVSEESMTFSTLEIIGSGISVLSSPYGPRSSTEAALDLFAKGVVRGHFNTEPLDKVNEVIDKLRAYEITGRTVLIPNHHH